MKQGLSQHGGFSGEEWDRGETGKGIADDGDGGGGVRYVWWELDPKKPWRDVVTSLPDEAGEVLENDGGGESRRLRTRYGEPRSRAKMLLLTTSNNFERESSGW